MVWRSLLLSLLAVSAGASKDTYNCYRKPKESLDRRSDKSVLRVATFNAEFLFLDPSTGALTCPGTECPWKNETQAKAHADEIIHVLKMLDADVINLVEIEGCDELEYLTERLTGYRKYLIRGKDSYTGQNVALLTRVDPVEDLQRTTDLAAYPVSGSECGYDGSGGQYGVSKHYFTSITVGGTNIALVGAHLLAFPTDPSRCAFREAQATVLRGIIEQYLTDGYEVILFGDLNDFDGDVMDKNSNKPSSSVLSTLKGSQLRNVAEIVPKAERYTHWWDKRKDCKEVPQELSMIDHVLVSDGLFNRMSNATFYHGYTQRCGTLDSDHWPVFADFQF